MIALVLVQTYSYEPEPLATWQEWTVLWMFVLVGTLVAGFWEK